MMNTKILGLRESPVRYFPRLLAKAEPLLLLVTLILIWCFSPEWLRNTDVMSGSIDQSIWLLVLLSLIVFLLIVIMCWWLLQHFWLLAGLPPILQMVSQFKTLKLWQQLAFYWASLALLLSTALGSLIAIC